MVDMLDNLHICLDCANLEALGRVVVGFASHAAQRQRTSFGYFDLMVLLILVYMFAKFIERV